MKRVEEMSLETICKDRIIQASGSKGMQKDGDLISLLCWEIPLVQENGFDAIAGGNTGKQVRRPLHESNVS